MKYGPGRCYKRLAGAAVFAALMLSCAYATEPERLPASKGDVLLTVTGAIGVTNEGASATFDRAMIEAFPARTLVTHTSVTDGPQTFDGILMRDLLDRLNADGETVVAYAINDYAIEIPLSDFRAFDVVLATHMNGNALTVRDKGPLWIVYPRDDHARLQDIRYDYRWVWQLVSLHVQ